MKKYLRNFVMLGLVWGSLSMVSCRETNEEDPAPPMQHEMREGEQMHEGTHEGTQDSATDAAVMEDRVTASFNDETVASNYQHYINIKRALVQTDAAMAQERAQEMLTNMNGREGGSRVENAVREIAATTNVNEQREAFSGLTAAMEDQLEGAIATGEIYKQYCPMAFEGKGDSWFSNSKEIRNPYYGDKMLKCGRVEATLN